MNTFDIDIHIGLEIHVQLLTKSKMFCRCPAKFGELPNSNVCPVCLGYPGMLPVPNIEALQYAYTVAKSLRCTLAPIMQFDRKNYYYPDLPKNYQITQYYYPLGTKGRFDFEFKEQYTSLQIKQAHLEEDAGKLIHTSDVTLCDYNRSGTPLMEIVTMPDIHSPEEAEAVLKQFRRLVRYLGVCDGNMEEGSLRCDANISVNHKGKGLGSKVEIKNVNSFKFVRMALEFEVERQSKMLAEKTPIVQETRLWNENRDITESMRTKEYEDDYRYHPEPDIIPYALPQSFFDALDMLTGESPLERRKRLQSAYNLKGTTLDFLTDEKYYCDFFEETIAEGASPELVISWMISDVQRLLNKYGMSLEDAPVTPKRLGKMLILLQDGQLHGKLAKQLLDKIFSEDADPEDLIDAYQLKTISVEEIETVIEKVLHAHHDVILQYKAGDKKPIGFLMGKIMSETQGKADPHIVQRELMSRLSKE